MTKSEFPEFRWKRLRIWHRSVIHQQWDDRHISFKCMSDLEPNKVARLVDASNVGATFA